MSDVKRMNVNFPPSVRATLERLARDSNRTMTDVLRGAIEREDYLLTQQREGGRVLVERGGEVRELVLL